jgi:hypothetical protein
MSARLKLLFLKASPYPLGDLLPTAVYPNAFIFSCLFMNVTQKTGHGWVSVFFYQLKFYSNI